MTLAQAIISAHAGEQEGFDVLFHFTAPAVWLSAVVLGCGHVGTLAAEIYQTAYDSIGSLRSPSDLRLWMGRITYDTLLHHARVQGSPIVHVREEAQLAYQSIAVLPQEERTILLMMCADGFSASQSAELLAQADVDSRRTMRHARQTVAQYMRQHGCTHVCNTGWLIDICNQLRDAVAHEEAQAMEVVLGCVLTGTPYTEPESAPAPQQEKAGFLKWFRSKRFG